MLGSLGLLLMTTKLCMLWHDQFFDASLNGMAELDGEKLYFVEHPGQAVDSYEVDFRHKRSPGAPTDSLGDLVPEGSVYPFELDAYEDLPRQVLDALEKIDLDSDVIRFCTAEYHIDAERNIMSVYPCRFYDLYRPSAEELEYFCARHAEFQQKVGHHIDYGSVYRPYDPSQASAEFYDRGPPRSPLTFPPRTFVGTFRQDQFAK